MHLGVSNHDTNYGKRKSVAKMMTIASMIVNKSWTIVNCFCGAHLHCPADKTVPIRVSWRQSSTCPLLQKSDGLTETFVLVHTRCPIYVLEAQIEKNCIYPAFPTLFWRIISWCLGSVPAGFIALIDFQTWVQCVCYFVDFPEKLGFHVCYLLFAGYFC